MSDESTSARIADPFHPFRPLPKPFRERVRPLPETPSRTQAPLRGRSGRGRAGRSHETGTGSPLEERAIRGHAAKRRDCGAQGDGRAQCGMRFRCIRDGSILHRSGYRYNRNVCHGCATVQWRLFARAVGPGRPRLADTKSARRPLFCRTSNGYPTRTARSILLDTPPLFIVAESARGGRIPEHTFAKKGYTYAHEQAAENKGSRS
jgi:hypothetical protein